MTTIYTASGPVCLPYDEAHAFLTIPPAILDVTTASEYIHIRPWSRPWLLPKARAGTALWIAKHGRSRVERFAA